MNQSVIKTFTMCGISTALLVAAVSGCSDGKPRRYPVQGKVTFPDGKVLTRGTVEFRSIDHNPSLTATGSIQSEGRFELETSGEKDGAIAGRHRVVVLGDDEIGSREERPWKLSKSQVHPRYADYKTTDLEVLVEPRRNTITLEVEYAPDK